MSKRAKKLASRKELRTKLEVTQNQDNDEDYCKESQTEAMQPEQNKDQDNISKDNKDGEVSDENENPGNEYQDEMKTIIKMKMTMGIKIKMKMSVKMKMKMKKC